jgi:hypothetical protein
MTNQPYITIERMDHEDFKASIRTAPFIAWLSWGAAELSQE